MNNLLLFSRHKAFENVQSQAKDVSGGQHTSPESSSQRLTHHTLFTKPNKLSKGSCEDARFEDSRNARAVNLLCNQDFPTD